MVANAAAGFRRRRARARRNGAGANASRSNGHAAPNGSQVAADPPFSAAVVELEDVLIAELRLAQTIDTLADQDREAILGGDTPAAAAVARAMTTCLAELSRLEAEHDRAVRRLAEQTGLPFDLTLEQLLPHLDAATAQRLGVYRLGIIAHLEHSRSLRPASQALAVLGNHGKRRHLIMRLVLGAQGSVAEPYG